MTVAMFLRIVMYAPIIGVGAILHVIESGANMTWILALCVVIILSVVFAIFMIVMPKFKIMQKMIDKMNSVVRELLDGMLVIRAFNMSILKKLNLIKRIKTLLLFLYLQHALWHL